MAKVFNAQALAAKWKTNFARSGDAYKAGVQGVQVAPGIAAAAAAPKMVQNLQASVDSGRYQAAVSSVPLNAWQQQCVNKGVQRFSSGSEAGAPKMQTYMNAAAPVYQDISATASSMNNDGSTESQAAIVAMAINKMKQLKGAGKGR